MNLFLVTSLANREGGMPSVLKKRGTPKVLRILHVTNMWPSRAFPHYGSFVKSQVESLQHAGALCDVVRSSKGGIKKYKELRIRARSRMLEFYPHIVHVHFGWTGAAIAGVCNSNDVPLVISYCGGDINGEAGSFVRRCKHRFGVFLSLRAGRMADRLIVKNKSMMAMLPGRLLAKTRLLPNGVDTDLFIPMSRSMAKKNLGWPLDQAVVLFAGRVDDPTKNFMLAQKAVEQARKHMPGLVLKTPELIPHDEMPVWLNAADVLLMTSLKEGSPNIVKEALSCDLPIVSVDVGDVRWILDGLKSCVVTDYDANSLSKGIIRLLAEPGAAGERRNRILQYGLDSKTIAERLITIYGELIQ